MFRLAMLAVVLAATLACNAQPATVEVPADTDVSTPEPTATPTREQLTLSEYAAACGEINKSLIDEQDVFARVEKHLKARRKLAPPDELRGFHNATVTWANLVVERRSLTDLDVLLLDQALQGQVLKLSEDARGTLITNGCLGEK